jgi:hypothetical protein
MIEYDGMYRIGQQCQNIARLVATFISYNIMFPGPYRDSKTGIHTAHPLARDSPQSRKTVQDFQISAYENQKGR